MDVALHMFQPILHHIIICIGLFINLSTIIIIVLKTPKSFKEYSCLLLNVSITEFLSVITHFIVNGRLFVTVNSVVIIAGGSCCAISDYFCSVATGLLNINTIHSVSIIALAFWYRTRILKEKGPLGVLRLQFICLVFFVLNIPSIIVFVQTISAKIELEPIIDYFYEKSHSSEFGLYGYSNLTEPGPLIFATYMVAFPCCAFLYIGITRYRLLSMLREKSRQMSEKTRSTHAALTKALTIHAILPIYVMSSMTALIFAQLFFDIHTAEIESLEFDIAVLPALINPCLTLYFVKPYRIHQPNAVSTRKIISHHDSY